MIEQTNQPKAKKDRINPKVSSILIAILVCTIIWFMGWTIFNTLQFETSITSTAYQNILIFLEVSFIVVYSYIQYRAFHKQPSQLPKPLQEAVKDLKTAGEKLSKISLLTEAQSPDSTSPELTREETIISSPELPLDQLEEESEESSTKGMKLSDMRRKVTLKRLELQIAVYEKLKQDVESGSITIKTAEDILASDGSKVPATLESSSTKKTEEPKKDIEQKPVPKVRSSKL